MTFLFCLLLHRALKHNHVYQVTLTKVTTGNFDSQAPKLDTIINVIVPAKRWQWGRGGGLLANAFLTVAKRRLLKVAMTRVLFD